MLTKKKFEENKKVLWIPVALAVLLIFWALKSGIQTASFVSNAERVNGVVIENTKQYVGGGRDHRGNSRSSGAIRISVVEYEIPSGKKTTYPVGGGSKDFAFSEGDSVPLYYLADNPFECKVGTFWFLCGYQLMALLGAAGLLLMARYLKNRDWETYKRKKEARLERFMKS